MSEEKFLHPALDNLYQTLADIEAAEQALKAAEQRLPEVVKELPSKIGDNKDLRDAIMHHLYWFDERVPASLLRDAFQVKVAAHARKNEVEKILRNASLEVICSSCQQPYQIEVTSRSEMQRQQAYIANKVSQVLTCTRCRAQRDTQLQQWYEQERKTLYVKPLEGQFARKEKIH